MYLGKKALGGQWGTALRFDGSNQAYLKAGSFRIEGALSFAAWVRKENLGRYQRIFDFGNSANNHNLLLTNRWESSEAEWSIRRGGSNRSLIVTNFWTLNQWQHVVCTVDESGVMKLFRNGELLGSVLGHLPSGVTRSGHLIGKSHWSNNHYFQGSIDDLRLYERAISTFEADQIFKGDLKTELMLGGEDPNVFVYWGDEDAGQITDVNSTLDSSWDARVDLGILSPGQFSTGLVGLQPGKTYYYRVFASNSAGSTSLSEVQSFSTGSFEFRADSLSNSNFLLWLDANDINGDNDPTNEPFGGTVDKWFDKSGLNLHAGNGNGPELRINNLNGLPVLKFDGLNNYLRVSNSNSLNVGEEITLFIVAKGDTLSDWRPVISKRGENNVGWQFRKDNTDFASFTIRGTSGNDGQRGGTEINGVPHVWTARKSTLHRSQWVDGNLEYKIQDRGIIPSTSSDLVIGGRDQDGITALGAVEIGEILLFANALDDEEVSKVQGYLSRKWGLLSNMPEAHPYKYIVPKFENRPVITLSETNSYKKGLDVSFTVTTTRPASNFQAFGLPPGLDINSSSGLISGIPTKSGSYTSKLEASSVSGTYTKDINFIITDFSNWEYSTTINFPGFSNQSVLYDFPVYVELNTSIPGFSYDQFASPYGYDLRFLDNNGSRELKYEPVKWNPYGVSSFWVLMPEFDQNTSIFAIWGNNEAIQQPNYCKDGSVWSNYHAVWHMDGTSDTTVKESKISAHAIPYNFDELRVPGLFGTAVSFDGVDDYIDLPITVHPQEGTEQITISFWSFGGDQLDSSSRTSILESGSAQRRSLNIHFPLNSRLYWQAGYDNTVDSIDKPFENPMVSGIIGLFKKMLMQAQWQCLGMELNGTKVSIKQDLLVERLIFSD